MSCLFLALAVTQIYTKVPIDKNIFKYVQIFIFVVGLMRHNLKCFIQVPL